MNNNSFDELPSLLDKPGREPRMLLDGRWFSSSELAEFLHVDASTIRRWRTASPPQGPPFIQVSDRVFLYKSHDVEVWLASRRVDPGGAA